MGGEQVIYETRLHASRPYTSNYPPQPSSSQAYEGGKGGFFSILSARGISQLKEKWGNYRNPTKIKKPISLFISPSGERVAVATRCQITILWKENDYQEPCGIFTCNGCGSFSCGAWSESHDVLGVSDDVDTLYFIKANGEEITRVTKRQLKVSSPIIGLFPQADSDERGSCLCSFIILTSDGFLHCIEISQEPSASVSSKYSSNSSFTSKRQFPEDVVCLDYDQENSFLVVVGSTTSTSMTSGGSFGSCHLSLWRRSQNLDLEALSSIPFEGLYCKPKDYASQIACPKVLISALGNFVATLDTAGCLHIFSMDKERCSLSSFSGRQRLSSESTKNVFCGQIEFLSDIVDFTWWSDHIVTLAKRGGIVTMLDILTGFKVQENDAAYSMPVLDRVQQFKGHILLLESKPSEEKILSSPYTESGDSHLVEQIIRDRFNQVDYSRTHWRLISITQRSVPEMYSILIQKKEYQAALNFAHCHSLDKDEVLKSQWLNSIHGTNEVNKFLPNIKDLAFVLSECVDKVGTTEDAVKALLAHGLQVSDKFCFSESEDHECSQIWDFRIARLQLLQFRDRLETYLGINMGRFSMHEYSKFRIMPLSETAVTLAESGKIGALNLLFRRHPYSLSTSILTILAAVPETIPVQTYGQLLPGRSPPASIALREEDWVECEEMVSFIKKLPEDHEIGIQMKTEPIVKRCVGYLWPSADELSIWYKNRAKDIDHHSGQLDNCLFLVDFACRKGIIELKQFHEDISYLHQIVYYDDIDEEICFNSSLDAWEQLSDYDKFRMILKNVKEENVVKRLQDKAIPFMQNRSPSGRSSTQHQPIYGQLTFEHKDCFNISQSFLVRWLMEIASENKLDICLVVIDEGCRDFPNNGFFKDESDAVDCALLCIYLCTATDRWSNMAAILSKLQQKQDAWICSKSLEKRLKLAEGHIEAGRLLAFYQVPKQMNFFHEGHADEKGVKQILRLILSKFVRRQPGRSDSDWATMWQDMQCLREKAFPFLDSEYMLMEFCRGLLKAGKFSLARNYLKGTSTVPLVPEKAETLVIQASREYFFSASSLTCSEIWKAKECLNLYPNSINVKKEADIIDALTVKLPNLGVSLLPLQFRQIKDPMEIIKMAITSQAGAYVHFDELIEVAKLLGLSSPDDISAVEEAIAREAAVAGDLQLAFDLCLILAKKGHGLIWDLCAAIARGPALENMDINSRKQLLGFALSHCDEESIGELLHAWKDLDTQGQCETLYMLTGTSLPTFPVQDSTILSFPAHGIEDMVALKDCSKLVGVVCDNDEESCFRSIKDTLSSVAKYSTVESGTDLEVESLLRENGKVLSFVSSQLPWLLGLIKEAENASKSSSRLIPGRKYMSICTQAVTAILSWLARNGFSPKDTVIASLAKSIIEPPVSEEEDVMGCSFLLNLVDAFSGVKVIEEQLRIRERYQEICSIMNVGMTYSLLHNSAVECKDPAQRRELLLRRFTEKHAALTSDEISKIDEVQSNFWKEWKLKLKEKKRVAEHSRALEQIIPGVETARFLSGDFNYIQNAVFSLIESVKLEKKHIRNDVLELADTYGLNHTEVLLRYLTSILVSEVWTDDDVKEEISDVKDEIIGFASETIKSLSSVVYDAINGQNKGRLAQIYGLLSDCCLKLEETKGSLPTIHPWSSGLSTLQLARFFRVLQQECQRVSFVKNLNFKNVAGLDGLNLQSFRSEVYAHVDEFNLEALAKMVETLVGMYSDKRPEGVISWQDVYKHYVLSLLATLESSAKTDLNISTPEKFQEYINRLEHTYDFCKMYIRLLSHSDALDIIKRFFTVVIPLHGSIGVIPDNSTWQDCLIIILNFWVRVAEEMQEIAYHESLAEEIMFDSEVLSNCLKVLMKLVMEDTVSPRQGWSTIVHYVNYGLNGDITLEILMFCRAMVFSGCGFGAISEVFLETMSRHKSSQASTANSEQQNLTHLYMNIFEPILQDLISESLENQNLYHLLSSLSKLEGRIEDLQKVRCVVWERMALFSDDLQLPSNVRVYVLELMQFVAGRNIKGFSTRLESNVLPWEGWDGLLFTANKTDNTTGLWLPDRTESSSRLTSTLVALKSSQLVVAISQSIEITPDDLSNVDTAVSCFLKLCEASGSPAHLDALVAILDEWEGLFVTGRNEVDSAQAPESGNDWSNDDWDEGWESFQDIESVEKEKTENSNCVHPLHACWIELFKKLVILSHFNDVLRLIDRSLSKSYGILIDEEGARSLSQLVLEMDCFAALKLVLLLPYDKLHAQCLAAVEDKLKVGGVSDNISWDRDFLVLVLSSAAVSSIITNPSYGTTFSYLCYLVGNFSRQSQEAQLSRLVQRSKESASTEKDFVLLFTRILFPCFISELVKADQQILAGFIVTKFMHTNPYLSLINTTEASLRRYLDRQLHALQHQEFATELNSSEILKNTVCHLRDKLENLIQSALGSLPTKVR